MYISLLRWDYSNAFSDLLCSTGIIGLGLLATDYSCHIEPVELVQPIMWAYYAKSQR